MEDFNQLVVNSFFESQFQELDLLNNLKRMGSQYKQIIFLYQCCFLDKISQYKCSAKSTKKRFKWILQKYYTGHEYEKVDLLFFHQWQRNDYIEYHAENYKKQLSNESDLYSKIIEELNTNNMTENEVRSNFDSRFILIKDLVNHLPNVSSLPKAIKYFQNFSNADVLYHFGRCTSVHHGNTLLLNATSSGGYKDNHMITTHLLNKTIRSILDKLKKECEQKQKCPWELETVEI